jgi:hypothetical protein
MIVYFWAVKNATWFMYNGKTFLKLYGGPDAMVYCLETRKRFVFKPRNAKVVLYEPARI